MNGVLTDDAYARELMKLAKQFAVGIGKQQDNLLTKKASKEAKKRTVADDGLPCSTGFKTIQNNVKFIIFRY